MSGILVHEWIEKIGGSENVLEALADVFQDADILCLWNNAPERFAGRFVRESVLARTPLRGRKAATLPLTPALWRQQSNRGYDWALVSSHSFAHHVSFKGQAPEFVKLVYVHTPARYVWNPELDARGDNPLVRAFAAPLKGLDRRRASEAVSIAANSRYVARRIQKSWGRESIVIHPPVEVSDIASCADWAEAIEDSEQSIVDALPSEFVLGASRFIPYKRLDLAIRAGESSGFPVVIAGAGPDEQSLRTLAANASVPVTIVTRPSNALLRTLYQRALVFVFPAVEDFGIMPVEAMAAGTPVVCSSAGGVPETVIDGETGAHVRQWENRELARAVEAASNLSSGVVTAHARQFSQEQFRANIIEWWNEFAGSRR
ncbi:glycosyltransferase [Paramicrobacterium sp. CJ85]|uniref:glycosyltransferase n=1 Tax=Paramicrobacterium sp. CJ85 TaxID=3445355 RepID=UPI003F5EB0E6